MNQKPIHTISFGRIRGAIWANENGNGTWYTVTVTRTYRDESGDLQDSTSFDPLRDLPVVNKVNDKCTDWVFERMQQDRSESTD